MHRIFTKLPIFDTKKIEDVEKTLNQLKEEWVSRLNRTIYRKYKRSIHLLSIRERKLGGAFDPKPEEPKWKMIFSKDR